MTRRIKPRVYNKRWTRRILHRCLLLRNF